MLLSEIYVTEMSAAQLLNIEQQIKDMLKPFRIMVIFTSHFEDRSVSGHLDKSGVDRGSQITADDLLHTFNTIVDGHIEEFGKAIIPQGVIHDTLTKRNIPYQLKYIEKGDKTHLYLITIMKKQNFQTSKKFPIVRI